MMGAEKKGHMKEQFLKKLVRLFGLNWGKIMNPQTRDVWVLSIISLEIAITFTSPERLRGTTGTGNMVWRWW